MCLQRCRNEALEYGVGESNELNVLSSKSTRPCNDGECDCSAAPDCCPCRLESLLSDYCHNRVLISRDSLAGVMSRVAVEMFVAHLCCSLSAHPQQQLTDQSRSLLEHFVQ